MTAAQPQPAQRAKADVATANKNDAVAQSAWPRFALPRLDWQARAAQMRSREYWRSQWAPLAFWGSTVLAALAFFAGAWERRWIADDGLIVLRTVRNLLAGNGPVFNAGERVEANTSTIWTYLIYGGQRLARAPQLELVVLWIALLCSVAAIVFAAWGTRIMWAGSAAQRLRHQLITKRTLLLPLGLLIYIVLPPARDFATSGLETSLVICWLALVWLLLQHWARTSHRNYRLGVPTLGTALLAFVAGLGPLVRPEMALVAVAVLALIFCARSSWLHRVWLVGIAGALPVLYQIWRMSYYALPYPNTAVAKDAAGAKWEQGFRYLLDFNNPYWLALPLVLAVITVGFAAFGSFLWTAPQQGQESAVPVAAEKHKKTGKNATGKNGKAKTTEHEDMTCMDRAWQWRGRFPKLRSTAVATALYTVCGGILLLYSLRVGGDFMHGRVLLPPLFVLLLPLAVLPIPLAGQRRRDPRYRWLIAVLFGGWALVAGWAIVVAIAQNPFPDRPVRITTSGIVDERSFYVQRTGHKHPLLARDYLDFPRMRAMVQQVRMNQLGAVFLPVGGVLDRWDVVDYDHPLPGLQPYELPDKPTHTVVFLNLGMTSMNLPLDVKVYDTMGLATPLAAHTERLVDGRIGHDKNLLPDWFIADAGVVVNPRHLPSWMEPDTVEQAKVALTCPTTIALRESYAGPLTIERRKSNLRNAFSYAEYRINRIPSYEVQRCGLPMPDEVDLNAFPR